MDDKLQAELREALKAISMKPSASRAMLNSRIRRLKADLQKQGTEENQQKLLQIEAAETLLFTHLDALHLVEEDEEMLQNDNYTLFRKTTDKKISLLKRLRVNYKLLALILIPMILIIVVISTVITMQNNVESRYMELERMMLNFNRFNYETIAETIDELPSDYRNVNTIKEEYAYIMEFVHIIEDGELQTDYETMRQAYARLKVLNNELADWDFHRYFARYDNEIFLYGIIWTNDWYYFRILHEPKASQSFEELHTNLPSQRYADIDYIFTRDVTYTHLNFQGISKDHMVRGYRVLSVSQYELRVYVYSIGDVITLRRGYFRLDHEIAEDDENAKTLIS